MELAVDDRTIKEILLASRIIITSLDKCMLKYVEHAMDNPHEMWRALTTHFELHSSTTIQSLKIQFLSFKKDRNETIDAFAARIDGMAKRIHFASATTTKEQITDNDKINVLYRAIGEEYLPVVQVQKLLVNAGNWLDVVKSLRNFELD